MAALHFLLPTGDSRSGRRSLIPNISLLPLDEVPVHVHRFAARAPCDSKGSECQCGIHRAEAASALRSRKTERAAKEKPTPISRFFLAPAAPLPPFTFCCPQAIVDQDAGVSIPNLISLLPLDEVPLHVHRFAARAPCDSKGSEGQCGIHRAEAASALRSRKTERAAKEKPTPISQFFFSTCCAWHPNSPPRPGEAPHPAPSARKSATRTAQKTALRAPCAP